MALFSSFGGERFVLENHRNVSSFCVWLAHFGRPDFYFVYLLCFSCFYCASDDFLPSPPLVFPFSILSQFFFPALAPDVPNWHDTVLPDLPVFAILSRFVEIIAFQAMFQFVRFHFFILAPANAIIPLFNERSTGVGGGIPSVIVSLLGHVNEMPFSLCWLTSLLCNHLTAPDPTEVNNYSADFERKIARRMSMNDFVSEFIWCNIMIIVLLLA